MSGNQNFQAQVNFYHEATGTRNVGDTFCVTDSHVAQQLEQMGYIKKMDAQAHSEMNQAAQDQQAKQQEYGQAQAKANEQAGIAAHDQNMKANQLTQEMAKASQQMSQQAASQQAQMTNADKAMVHDQAHAFQPSATTSAQAKAKVEQMKAQKAKVAEQNENK